MFVRVNSDFRPLFFKFLTTSIVALASKSSDKLEARDAEDKKFAKLNILYPLVQNFISQSQRKCSDASFSSGHGRAPH
jgi:hypothetical protein